LFPGRIRQTTTPATSSRIGFAAYLTSHSHYRAGVYSAPDIWAEIFDTGTAA
jgi:hypothetical protein